MFSKLSQKRPILKVTEVCFAVGSLTKPLSLWMEFWSTLEKTRKILNDFYYSFKQFCLLIINSQNEHDFSKTIPRYLFKEKGYLLEVYKKYNPKKAVEMLK